MQATQIVISVRKEANKLNRRSGFPIQLRDNLANDEGRLVSIPDWEVHNDVSSLVHQRDAHANAGFSWILSKQLENYRGIQQQNQCEPRSQRRCVRPCRQAAGEKSSITEIFPKFRAKRELADTPIALQHHQISITISSKSLNYASSLCPVRHHSVRLLLYVSESTLSLIDVDRLRTRKSPAFLTREMPT